jgi:hypothetical protein
MKQLNPLVLAVSLAAWLFVPSGSAQVLPGTTNIADRVGRIILPDHKPLDTSSSSLAARPPRIERPDLAPEIKLRMARFEQSREAYLARQEELLRKLGGATDSDRELIRKQLQQLRDEWRERARALQEDAKTRMRELQSELPRYRDALRDAQEGALDAVHSRRGDK